MTDTIAQETKEKDYGVFNNFCEKVDSLSTGLAVGGIAVLAFEIAAGLGPIIGVPSLIAGVLTQVMLEGANPEGELSFSSKNKPAFFTGLIAPFVVAAGMTAGAIIDKQNTIIQQNKTILEQVQILRPK